MKNNNTHTNFTTTFFVGEFWLEDFRAKFQNITERWRGFHKLRCGSLVDTSIKRDMCVLTKLSEQIQYTTKAIYEKHYSMSIENCRWVCFAGGS